MFVQVSKAIRQVGRHTGSVPSPSTLMIQYTVDIRFRSTALYPRREWCSTYSLKRFSSKALLYRIRARLVLNSYSLLRTATPLASSVASAEENLNLIFLH
jgi:hypothetical protein